MRIRPVLVCVIVEVREVEEEKESHITSKLRICDMGPWLETPEARAPGLVPLLLVGRLWRTASREGLTAIATSVLRVIDMQRSNGKYASSRGFALRHPGF